MGKAYANKKKESERPNGDFYSTPKSLVWVAEDIIKKEFKGDIIDPCAGQKYEPIWEVLNFDFDIDTYANDLYSPDTGRNYLTDDYFLMFPEVITNPPFSLWDEFVLKAKTHCTKFMFIGRLNYFGTLRNRSGIWKNLKAVYPFNRYVDYQTPYRKDGLFHVGAMATAWFLWDMKYKKEPIIKTLDVQKYAKLGAFKNSEY